MHCNRVSTIDKTPSIATTRFESHHSDADDNNRHCAAPANAIFNPAVHPPAVNIYSPTPFDAVKALKLEEDFPGAGMTMSMYPSPDKMGKMSTGGCFPGRYSPSAYRGPGDQMRRCMGNPSVSDVVVTRG